MIGRKRGTFITRATAMAEQLDPNELVTIEEMAVRTLAMVIYG